MSGKDILVSMHAVLGVTVLSINVSLHHTVMSWYHQLQADYDSWLLLGFSVIIPFLAIVSCSLQELSKLMKQDSLKPGDVLEVFLPARGSSVWLNQDVVLIDRYTVTPSNLIINAIILNQSMQSFKLPIIVIC